MLTRNPDYTRRADISFNDNDYLTATPSLPESVAFLLPIWHRRAGRQGANCRSGCGCSSGVEHNLAKVGVEGSNPFARSSLLGRPHVWLSSQVWGWACHVSRSVVLTNLSESLPGWSAARVTSRGCLFQAMRMASRSTSRYGRTATA